MCWWETFLRCRYPHFTLFLQFVDFCSDLSILGSCQHTYIPFFFFFLVAVALLFFICCFRHWWVLQRPFSMQREGILSQHGWLVFLHRLVNASSVNVCYENRCTHSGFWLLATLTQEKTEKLKATLLLSLREESRLNVNRMKGKDLKCERSIWIFSLLTNFI